MSRAHQVKNRAPAPIQVTAEHLIREAQEKHLEKVEKPPKQFITDKEELALYQQGKRKDFEDQIRRSRNHIGLWTRYAEWEATQKEYERARSVFERALDIDYRSQTIWFKYAEMEMKGKFINHARNVYDRAVTLHPRVDSFWLKYTYMEELVGAIDQCRQVFERFMKWEPDDNGWGAYVKFEMRQGEIGRARGIYERYIALHQTSKAFLKYARWEEQQSQKALARKVYERSLVEIHEMERTEKLLVSFARFEERCHEYERSKVIYKYAIDRIRQGEMVEDEASDELKKEFAAFEKRHGSRKDIEDVIMNKRREQYEQLIANDKYNYDHWFDYCRLEETDGTLETCRDVYERAIANIPLIQEKKYWSRYIYLWIYYAVFEELQAEDAVRTREVYAMCLNIIPHKKFTFGKIWLHAAHFEVRQNDLTAARKLLGQCIGLTGKENVFKGYLEMELQLGEIDRCRSIYKKYLEAMPYNCHAWKAFAQLETNLGETQRSRAIFDLAIMQPSLDMPELLWKSYIDFEISEGEAGNVRQLYERLLDRSSHVKVWTSYGQFEASELGAGIMQARVVFEKGYENLKEQQLKEERLMILEAWRDAEANASSDNLSDEDRKERGVGNVTAVEAKLPKKIKMRRMAKDEYGNDMGWEEYYDYHFPDDEKKVVGLKLLENAMKWKNAMSGGVGGFEDNGNTNSNSSNDDLPPDFFDNGDANASSMLGKRDNAEIDLDDNI